jgi:predicted PurR-regulated permease PerM
MDRNRAFLLLAIAVFLAFGALLALPLLQYLLLAVLLAYVLFPLQRRLAPVAGPRIAAGSLILAALFVVIVPIAVLLAVVVRRGVELLREVGTGELNVGVVDDYVRDAFGAEIGVGELLRSLLRDGQAGILRNAVDFLGGLTGALVGLTVVLFALYYLLKDGDDLVTWLRARTPLSPDVQDELADRMNRIMWAVFVVNVLIAVVQGVLTGIGFAIVGIPNVVFWTVMTVVLGLLPLIGASAIWIPAVAYLFLVGQPVDAAILLAYSATVVSLSDNYLRPVAGGHEAQLNPGLFIVGIFGGVAAIGFMGLFFGPVVLGALKALLDVTDDVFDAGGAAATGSATEDPPGSPPPSGGTDVDDTGSSTADRVDDGRCEGDRCESPSDGDRGPDGRITTDNDPASRTTRRDCDQ